MIDNYVVFELKTQLLTKKNYPKLFITTICKNKTAPKHKQAEKRRKNYILQHLRSHYYIQVECQKLKYSYYNLDDKLVSSCT